MADKCIGKLYLDIGQVKKDIEDVNKFLSQIGANINIEDKLSQKISAALGKLVKEAKRAGEEAQKAISQGLSADINVSVYEKMQQKVLAAENKMRAEADKTIAKQEERAEREAAAVERAEERKRAAREKQEAAYEQVWLKAEAERARAQAAEDARIDREVAKAEAAAEKKAAAEEKAAERTAAAREKQEAAYQKVWDKAIFDQRQNELKQYQKDIEDYAKALATMMNEQAKFNQQVASGKLVEGTEQYTQAEEKLRHLESAAISAGQKLDQSGREAAMGMQEVQTAIDNVNVSMGAINDAGQVSVLTQVENAYKQLTTAIKNYNIAKKAGNEEGMASQQAEINSAMQIITSIEQIVDKLNVESSVREQIRAKIEQAKIAQDAQAKGVGSAVQATGELESQVKGLVTRYLSLMAVIRSITNLMNNMVEYVSEYSDKMNEIQMITMKTDSEVAQLAETYRNLAADMSVSSLDMADAAIYFTRQGLGAAEIEKRLKNVTMYAKAANVEFKDASEIITAVVNSMGLVEQEAEDGREAAQRVADVFLNIGDHAATSGQEIGEAMQKAAASAGAFGVSMEWLAAYIATVSETTRQEARTIGTAFNTIIARLHQIKSTGYNQEDETKINDIAKALSKIDVALMDQSGNWRDMEIILQEIAKEWNNLDGKTKSYIATTMAGVKQQNVFLALMNDMSKGAEDGSRAFELYNLAIDSVGVASEKYGVYLDTVTASQERLTVAQEKFYSILNEDIIKGWNDALAGFINMLTSGAEAWGNWTIILPVVAGVITAVGIAIKGLNLKLGETVTLMTLLEAHPVMMAISAAILVIAGLVTIINGVASAVETADEKLKRINNTISESQNRVTTYESQLKRLDEMFTDIGDDSQMSADEIEKYNDLLNELSQISPRAAEAVEKLKNNIGDQKEAYEQINEEIERYIANEQIIQSLALSEKTGVKREVSEGEKFASIILERGHLGSMATSERYSIVEHEVSDNIQALIEDLVQREYSWDQIEKIVSARFMEGMNETDYLAKTANALIDEYINTIGMAMNSVDKAAVRSRLSNMIFGEDGILDFSEYQNMNNVLKNFIDQAILHGFDPQDLMSTRDRIKLIGENFFENLFDMMFGDQLDELMAGGEADIFADKLSVAISELMELGFSDIEIGDALRNVDLSEWVNAIELMRQKIIDEIKNNAGVEELGFSVLDMITGEETYDQSKWDELDVSTLKLVNDLILAGVEFDKINLALEQSESLDEFKGKLGELSAEFETSTEEAYNFGNSIKDIQNSVKDIQAIDKAIEDVQKNGKDFNVSDMFDLAQTHKELIPIIGDEDAVLERLIKIKEEATSNQRGLIKTMLLGDTDIMSGSSYAASGYDTLQEYRDSLTDPKAIEEFDAEIEQLVNEWQRLNEIIKKSSGETTEAEKSFSAAVKEVETLDTVIGKLENEQKVDFSDIIDLSTAHPEIIAVSGDMDVLLETLKNLRNEAKETVRLKIQSDIMNSKEWMANSEFASTGYETIGAYRASLNPAAGEDLAKVDRVIKESTDNIVGLSEAMGNLEESNTAAAKSFDATIDEIENINTALDKLDAGKKMDFSDLIDLSTAHPEILGAINDIETLKEVLASIRAEDTAAVLDEIYSKILGDDIKNSPFKDMASDTIKTLNDYKNTLEEGTPEFEAVSAYLEQCAMNLFAASDYLNQLDPATIQRWQDMFFGDGNVDLNNRKTIDARKLTEAGWEGAGDGIATIFSKTYSAGGEGADIHWNQNVVFDVTPITPDGKVLTPDELEAYMAELFEKSANMDELLANDAAGKGILIKIRTLLDDESFEAAMDNESKQMDLLHMLQEALYGVNEAEQTWLQTQAQQAQSDAEADWAESNGYLQQITGLQQALEEGGSEAALARFNSYLEQNEDIVEGLADTYPLLIQQLAEVEAAQEAYNEVLKDHDADSEEAQEAMAKLQKATQAFGGELNKTQKYLSTKHFKTTADAIKKLGEGTISATDAYDTFAAECDKVSKAQEDVNDVTQKLSKNSDVTVNDVSNLADVLGKSADQILSDWPAAVAEFNDLISAGGELESMFNALNEAAFIKITGVSEADFSNLENGLFAVNADAQALIELLQATGQWEVVPMDLPQNAKVWNPDGFGGGFWSTVSAVGKATVLKPTNNNPFKSSSSTGTTTSGSSGSSGGGGGGSSSSSGSTEVEKMLNLMQQVQDIQDNQKSYYQAQRSYYNQTGQLQGVIAYAEKEKAVLEDQNKTLQDNIDNIEEYMRAKSEELASLSTSDESYEEVADDLDKLQDAHADYTEQIIENKTAIEELNDTIDETNDTIRQMEIDLRELIYGAIEDREEKRKNMLENEIEMENIILDLIKKRYEIERDGILSTTDEKIAALQEERDLLSEQLELRKQQAEQEDKQLQLQELEVKYKRIMADPTRAKEAKELRKKIDDLREELSWQAAEDEVKAQQDSIDQQITSLEDYKAYIESYYEDILEHPQKLIEEMRQIISGTQEEILNWLKENDEDYQNATENTQQSMIESWTETYNEMKGILTLYWDEVEEIIEQGDDYIIDFLKENSADYAAAGKLQAEAYVDEWMEQLENLKKAYEEVATVAAASYETIEESTYSGNNGGSNNGGSSSTSSLLGNIDLGAAIISGIQTGVGNTGKSAATINKKSTSSKKNNISMYASGGEASSTGLAWLDGSLQEPERVLSPYQTKLFNSMVEALQSIDKISVPGMSNFGDIQSTGSNPISVGDIIVNVDNLDTDDDYEELAQKVGEVLMEEIGKTAVVGGIRIRSI